MSRDVLNMREAEVPVLRAAANDLLDALAGVVDELPPEAWDTLSAPLQARVTVALCKWRVPAGQRHLKAFYSQQSRERRAGA